MIHAVILSGGWGRRFWPKSRRRLPKQLLCIGKKRSPAQNLFNLIKLQIPEERIWVVANKVYAQSLRRQLPTLGKKNLLLEPLVKNTAAAVGLASVIIRRTDPRAVTVVLSSDHMLGQKRRFLHAINLACKKALEDDVLVTIGVRPHRAAQEFGYLKIAQSFPKESLRLPPGQVKLKAQSKKIYKVERFVEKPNIKRARAYLRSRSYLWNSGIFVWKATSILKAIKKYLPRLYSGLRKIEKAWDLPQYKSQLVKEYSRFKDISIDYGVMEKARDIYAVVGDFLWQDLGSWNNLPQENFGQDKQGNVIQGLHKGIDTCGSVILSGNRHLIGTVGVHDLIIVHTPSTTLICRKDKAQEVKKLTELLEKDKHLKKYL